jgi:hypothetical protein
MSPHHPIKRAARKWGRAIHNWGSTPHHTPTAIVYLVDFTGNSATSSNTTVGQVTWHPTNN